jgi:hypothetical protein
LCVHQSLCTALVFIFFPEGALSIEVWGHRCAGFTKSKEGWEVQQQLAKAQSLADRWVRRYASTCSRNMGNIDTDGKRYLETKQCVTSKLD